jgi:hypothetical protein
MAGHEISVELLSRSFPRKRESRRRTRLLQQNLLGPRFRGDERMGEADSF